MPETPPPLDIADLAAAMEPPAGSAFGIRVHYLTVPLVVLADEDAPPLSPTTVRAKLQDAVDAYLRAEGAPMTARVGAVREARP